MANNPSLWPESNIEHNLRSGNNSMNISLELNGPANHTNFHVQISISGPTSGATPGWVTMALDARYRWGWGTTITFTGTGVVTFSAVVSSLPPGGGGGVSSNIVTRTITVSNFPPHAPTNLNPSGQQNRTGPITLSWQHNPRPANQTGGVVDPQINSQVEYWQGTGARTTITVQGMANAHTIPANTFLTEASVNFRVRTQGGNGAGWGPWSAQSSFPLITINPPLAPTNLLPASMQNPTRQIRLEWTHNPAVAGVQDSQDGSEVEFWQGNGSRTVLDGEFGNRVTLMPDIFTMGAGNVSFRARTHGSRGGWGAWSAVATFALALDPPLAPTHLTPTDEQNRRMAINFSWRHTPNPADWDTQSDSQVEFWQGQTRPPNPTTISAGPSNRLELPADTFSTNDVVSFRVRTQTQRNSWGTWSEAASFPLSSFPPQAPIELAPTDTRNPRLDIVLTWRFVANGRWFPNDGQTDSQAEVWQGSGVRYTFRGYGENRAIIPANTFTNLIPLNFRARTHSNLGGWGPWSVAIQIPLAISPPLPPTELQPNLLSPQNPRGIIRITWRHNANPDMPNDEQTYSEVRFRQLNGEWRTFSGGAENIAMLPAFTFASYAVVEFQARTHTAINGWGGWSLSERFDLRMTPPLAPVLTHPVNIPARATDGIFLQWSYNSPYDIFPSRFDIRYRIGGGEWTEMRTDSQNGLPAPSNATTRPEAMQSRLEWQVRAWGELGDAGPWSDIATAFIIGIPPTPAIVKVSNSGRPEIIFSAQNATAWEIEILKDGQVIYSTGKRVFESVFKHVAGRFFENGNYVAQLRIINEYGIYSEWATLPFSIITTPPETIVLETANNLQYSTKLWFNGLGRTAYVYRAEVDEKSPDNTLNPSGKWLRIAAVTDSSSFEDWTVRPGQRYGYFIRAVGEGYSFADSITETAMAKFKETTIAPVDAMIDTKTNMPHDMVMLLTQLGGKPTKNSDFKQEKTLTHFSGRKKPVMQVGAHTDRVAQLAFYVSIADRDRLEELSRSDKVLILRDWRLGVIYGTITGGIKAQSDGLFDHCQVSFSFTETDHPLEVEIL